MSSQGTLQEEYSHPPIVEAIIEIRIVEDVDEKLLSRVSQAFGKSYPREEEIHSGAVQFHFHISKGNVGQPPKVDLKHGKRMWSDNALETTIVFPNSVTVAQLAPYPGWNAFSSRFQRDWLVWKKIVGIRKLQRIGLRYINRIDIPTTNAGLIEFEKYFVMRPLIPEAFPPLSSYSMNVEIPQPDMDGLLRINTSTVVAPILDHASFLLDQDLSRDANFPQKDEEFFLLLNDMRVRKNMVFESCVTDLARGLFRK